MNNNKHHTVYKTILAAFALWAGLVSFHTVRADGAGKGIYLRVTLGQGYEKPLQVHIFAMPGAGHYAISRTGMEAALNPSDASALLKSGAASPWCNLSVMIPEKGARLMISPDYTYSVKAKKFDAVLDFATAPSDDAIVSSISCDYSPSTLNLLIPSNLDSPDSLARFRTDMEMAEATGSLADAMTWPQLGKPPVNLPFFVTLNQLPDKFDRRVVDRELKTVAHFGFNGVGIKSDGGQDWHKYFEKFGLSKKFINGNIWYTKGSFSNPDIAKMKEWGGIYRQEHTGKGLRDDEITYLNLLDEPVGESMSLIATDEASVTAFREWVKSLGVPLQDLEAEAWEDVRPVVETDREAKPALYYYSQRFRPHALGTFMGVQKAVLKGLWKKPYLAAANFSDGAVYAANFYAQGVDYFEILHGTDQNAIWGEDWANLSSTFQLGAFNMQLMRDAARKNGQALGSFLIVCDGRMSLDLKLKAIGLVSRGARMLDAFYYGTAWGGQEKGMLIESPDEWHGLAEVIREIGAVEDWLLEAKAQKAKTALLYSSSSDIWTLNQNHAYGFDRMHNWLALTHAQIPVDIVHESEVADGFLKDYKVCYLSGPNLTRACAEKLKQWVLDGGTLVLTAGAASRNEYNREMATISDLLPVKWGEVEQFETRNAEGLGISSLNSQDTASVGGASFEVLSIKQKFPAQGLKQEQILGTFKDGSPAVIQVKAGGTLICYGFLPSLHYIKKTLTHRQNSLSELLEKSYSPWEYPADAREVIVSPVKDAGVEMPILSSVALVDATYMECGKGILIPLANHALKPIEKLELTVRVPGEVKGILSVHQGELPVKNLAPGLIGISLPLVSTDFLMISLR